MYAIKIKIESNYFLLTEINNDLLLDVALGYLPTIRCFLKAGQEMQAALDALNDTVAAELRKKINLLKKEISLFKAHIGTIGFPLDDYDIDLYAARKNIKVISCIDLN